MFTYQTQVDMNEVYGRGRYVEETGVIPALDLTNSAKVLRSGNDPIGPKSKTVTLPSITPLKKEAGTINSSGVFTAASSNTITSGEDIYWKLTVNVGEYNKYLNSLTLHDTIPAGLSVEVTDIVIKNTAGNIVTGTITDPAGVPLTGKITGEKTFVITLPKNGTAYENTYTITYKSTVDPAYFNGENGTDLSYKDIKNTAWLKFTWEPPGGSGGGMPGGETLETPHLDVTAKISARLITKSGAYVKTTPGDYITDTTDNRQGIITWTLTINPHKVDIKEGKITDTLPNGLTYTGNFKVTGVVQENGTSLTSGTAFANIAAKITAAASGNPLTIDVGAIGKNTVTVTFDTQIINPDVYSKNYPDGADDTKFTNKVTFNCETTDGLELKTDTSAQVTVKSMVLEKTSDATKYDYKNQTITWIITVNHNEMNMKDAYLIDTLPPYCSYKNITSSAGLASIPSVETGKDQDGNTTLKIPLDTINGKVTITLVTKVDVNHPDFIELTKANAVVEIKNNVSLYHDGYPGQVVATATASSKVNTTLLTKTGDFVKTAKDNDTVNYAIWLNPTQLIIKDNGYINYSVIDTIPAGLRLSLSTTSKVSLYYANVTADKNGVLSFTKGNPVAGADWSWSYDPPATNADKSTLTVKMADSQSYILEYACDVWGPGTDNYKKYKNEIYYNGHKNETSYKTEKTVEVSGGGTATVTVTARTTYIELIKTDAQTGKLMPGVSFVLIAPGGGTIGPVTTDAKGEAIFEGLLQNTTYTLRETTPAGYITMQDKVITTGTTINPIPTQTILNERGGVNIAIMKVDKAGNRPLSGAQFTLTNIDVGSTNYGTVYTAISGNNGYAEWRVPFGTYTLKETKAPNNYLLNGDTFTVIVDNDGSYTIINDTTGQRLANDFSGNAQIVNTRITSYSVSLQKVSSATGNPALAGATFALKVGETTRYTATSGSSGAVTFRDVAPGTYTLEETSAPTGYTKSSNTYTVTVADNGSYTITNKDGAVVGNSSGLTLTVINTYNSPIIDPTRPGTDPPPTTTTDPPVVTPPEVTPPTVPEYTEPQIPEPTTPTPPEREGSTMQPNEDGTWTEIGPDGTPLGTWRYDPELEEWIFDPIVPLANLPQTGSLYSYQLLIFVLLCGIMLILAGFALKRRGLEKK